MNSNMTHNLDLAITPIFEERMFSIFGMGRSKDPTLQIKGIWVKRGYEDQSTQFQMFSVEFNDLKEVVSGDILPLIHKSYIRLQSYCPVVLRRRVKRISKKKDLNKQIENGKSLVSNMAAVE